MDKTYTDNAVNEYIASLDESVVGDTRTLIGIMERITGKEPKVWNTTALGFDAYHYKYDSGREGDSFVLGFYPRKGKITVYLMDGTTRYAEQLSKLGKHTTTGYCLYIKQLSEVDLSVLEHILEQSSAYLKSLSQKGPIDRILWQTEK